MLDEKKVKLMTRLAFYEQTQGKEDFKVSAYYRKDYASLHTIYMGNRRIYLCSGTYFSGRNGQFSEQYEFWNDVFDAGNFGACISVSIDSVRSDCKSYFQ